MSAATTTRVRVRENQYRKDKPRPYIVRWTVDGRDKSESHPTKGAATKARNALLKAVDEGTKFDTRTGLPVEAARTSSCLDLAHKVVAKEWPHAKPRTRQTTVDSLAVVLQELVPPQMHATRPDRRVLVAALKVSLNPKDTRALTVPQQSALRWLEKSSLGVEELTEGLLEDALGRARVKLTSTDLGSRNVANQQRQSLSKLLTHARKGGLLKAAEVQRLPEASKATQQQANPVDPAEVVAVSRAARLVALVAWAPYRVSLSVMLYAGLRPEEVRALKVEDIDLLPAGPHGDDEWSVIHVRHARPEARKRFTDNGATTQEQDTKTGKERHIDIDDVLADLLRPLLVDASGKRRRGKELLVTTRNGTSVAMSDLAGAYKKARGLWAEGEDRYPSDITMPIPYSLRHCHATALLNGGMDEAAVAKRLGHSVAVLRSTYQNCLSGAEPHNHALMRRAMAK